MFIFIYRSPTRDNGLSLIFVAVSGPAKCALGLTCHSAGLGGEYFLQDLQACPPLGNQGSSTHEFGAGRFGSSGPPEGYLTALSPAGSQAHSSHSTSGSSFLNINS
ncbi:hypothetical protein NL108_003360 [Boleophthalmus pectinirostris]|nr:hypothetical protein NL108_003360 [Boleophthalmus pectinirostris]